ncbi:VCBS domain-containing protein [Luteibacter sp.]|uniref:VCBS domain-containing protein n=1 Tax=Luteibacter sp. TaxID=1886636 RepID=UPI003F81037E
MAQLPKGSQVVVIDDKSSGMDQLANALRGEHDISAIHVISHGASDSISLGTDTVTAANIDSFARQLGDVGSTMTKDGDILLYGCDVSGKDTAMVTEMARLTSADVASSTDETGAAARGGNWVLETSTGHIEARTLALDYDGLLELPTVDTTTKSISASEPSPLNATDADHATLSGWTITDSGQVTVTATVGDSSKGSLLDKGHGNVSGASLTFTGTAADAANWLNQLQFVAADVEIGNTAAKTTVDVTVKDVASGLTATKSQDVNITPSNDPVVVGDATQNVAEVDNGAGTVITKDTLAALDPEVSFGTQTPSQIVYSVTAIPAHGYLTLAGTRLGIGSVFTQQDVIDGKVRYVHTATGADQDTDDGFTARVNDGATPLAKSDTVHITLNIVPENQAPTIGGDGNVFEGQPANAVDTGNVGQYIVATTGGDPQDTALTITITALPMHGTLYYNGVAVKVGDQFDYADRNLLTYSNDGSETQGTDTLGVRVTDQGGGTGVKASTDGTITLHVQEVDDDPALIPASTRDATVTAAGDGTAQGAYTVKLTPQMIGASDVDSPPSNVSFVIDGAGMTHGYLLLNGLHLQPGQVFTMADITAGRVQYVQTAGATAGQVDTFNFKIVDNTTALRWNADGTTFTRIGGDYTGGLKTDTLKSYTFTIHLVNATSGNGGNFEPPTTNVTHNDSTYAGVDPGGNAIGSVDEGGTILLHGTKTGGVPTDFHTTPGLSYTADGVPSSQVVYTFLGFTNDAGTTGGGTLQKLVGGTWVNIAQYGTFTQADLDAGNVRFQHDGGENFHLKANFSVSAGVSVQQPDGTIVADTWTPSFDIYVNPVNDLPVVSGSSNTVIGEGETAMITTGQLGISDPDDATSQSYLESGTTLPGGGNNYAYNNDATGPNALRFVVNTLPTGGKLQYSTDHGAHWTDVTQGMILDASIITGDPLTTGLRFVSDGSEVRNTSFTVEAVDRWGQHSASTGTVGIQITNVNDAPVIAKDPTQTDPTIDAGSPNNIGGNPVNNPLTVKVGGYGQITTAMLQAYDPDSSDTQVQYSITSAPKYGSIARSTDGGKTFHVLGAGSSFTQADVAAGYIYYLNDGTESLNHTYSNTPDDTFGFTLSDGDKEQPGNSFWIYTTPANDAPVVKAPTGPVDIDSDTAANNKIPGFSVSDPDINANSDPSQDYLEVVVRLLHSDGSAFTAAEYSDVSIAMGGGITVDAAHNGVAGYLVVRGTRDDINKALQDLSVTFSTDRDAKYQVQVIADDRQRDPNGNLVITGGAASANGGSENQSTTPGTGTPTTAVNTTEYDWYSQAVPTKDGNLSAATVVIRASKDNDPGVLTGPGTVTTKEDQPTYIGGGFTVSDAESAAFGTPVTVTLHVDQGTLGVGGTGADTLVDGVTISGDNTGTLVLTGLASDIQALLNAGVGKGLTYQSAQDANHDQNGGAAGDVTLTVKFDDTGSTIGDDTGNGSVANNPPDITVAITIDAVNDAPTVSAGSGTVYLSGSTAVDGFTVGDVDVTDAGGITTGEKDFMQVTVRITDANGVPLPSTAYADIVLNSTTSGTAGAIVDGKYDGTDSALVIRGTRDQINAYLAGLHVSIGGALTNVDQSYRVEVVADDRLRDANGDLDGSNNANGGPNPGDNNTGTANVPGLPVDPYAAIDSSLSKNVTSNYRVVFPSSVNNPTVIGLNGENTGTENAAGTYVLQHITLSDPDAGDAPIQATITLPQGFLVNTVNGVAAGTGGSYHGTTFTVGTDGQGRSTITFTGSVDDVEAAINTVGIKMPNGTPLADKNGLWNGTFQVQLSVNDLGNHGDRPDQATLDADKTYNDGHYTGSVGDHYSYADGTAGSTDNKLVTTRVIDVTISSGEQVKEAGLVDGSGSQGVTGTETFALFNSLDTVTLGSGSNTLTLTLAQLQDLSHVADADKTLHTPNGTLVVTGYTVNMDGTATLTYHYQLDGKVNQPGLASSNDVITIQTRDSEAFVGHGTITVNIVDDAPKANADKADVTEDGAPVTGNVVTGSGPKDAADRLGADDPGATPVTGVKAGNVTGPVSGGVGGNVAGTYGTLKLNADGTYTYTLDPTNATVNALKTTSAPLTETFTYTIKDSDGDTSTTTLTITIHGNTDGTPSVTPHDGGNAPFGGDVTVWEAGLTTDGTPGESKSVDGTLDIVALDGLTSVTVKGVTLTVTQLKALTSGNPVTITTDNGSTLLLKGFSVTDSVGGVPTKGTLSYTYTLGGALNQANSDHGNETINLSVLDAGGGTSTGTLVVTIIDDVPTANADHADVTEDGAAATGNVIGGAGTTPGAGDVADRQGADKNATVTGVQAGTASGPVTGGVAGAVAGAWGDLTLNADGSYSYALHNNDPAINAMKDGDTKTETFSYTITDKDGDTSTTTLTITIHGHTDGTPGVTAKDNNGAAKGDATVYEAGLVDMPGGATTSGTIEVTAGDGLDSVNLYYNGQLAFTFSSADLARLANHQVGYGIGTPIGTLNITGFEVTSSVGGQMTVGKLSYRFDLGSAPHVPGDDSAMTFQFSVKDVTGVTGPTSDFVVTIIDDAPTAHNDTGDVTEDSGHALAGNVIGGAGAGPGDVADRVGADGATVTSVIANKTGGDVAGTVGTGLAGDYGKLTLNADGSYSYELDDTNAKVNALKDGEQLTETFHYTITDADGDTSTATLVITIHGKTDGAPSITPHDGNGVNSAGGDATVWESGLTTDGPTGEGKSVSDSLDIVAADGLDSITVGGQVLTAADLAALGPGHTVTITTPDGSTLELTSFTPSGMLGTTPRGGTLSYTYTLAGTHDQHGAASINDTISLDITDAGGTTTTGGKLIVTIMNDVPTANADHADVNEDGADATGNVLGGAGAGAGDVADRAGADAPTLVTGVQAGITTGTVTGGIGPGGVAGSYGTLTLDANGGYTYAVDNTNAAVNALKDGDTLTETYSYTITDADGDTSTTTLTITIHGHTDGVPSIVPVDGNGAAAGHATVHEAGLTDSSGSQVTGGTIDVSAADGLTSVSIGGTVLTSAQLDALHGGTPVTIHTPDGTLVLTDYVVTATNGTTTTAGTITYTYTLDHAVTQHTADSTDDIALVVNDAGGGVSTGTLQVDIVNDAPTANADRGDVNEDGAPLTGNVVTGSTHGDVPDRVGADATATPVTGVQAGNAGGPVSGHVGTGVAGQYGTLTLNADGSYSYAVDNANPVVNALKDGGTLTETYTYTITDADGDRSTTTLTITIHGRTDGTPTIGAVDGNGSATGHATVHEGGLVNHDGSQTTTGTLTVTADDGLASVTIGGTTLTADQLGQLSGGHPVTIHTPEGTLVLTGFQPTATNGGVPTAGTITYTYTLDHAVNQNGPDSTDTIALTVVDRGGGTSNGTLVVDIANDVPAAHDDTATIIQDGGQTSASGNVYVGDDRIGADGAAAGGPVTGVSSQNTGAAGVIGGNSVGAYGTLVLNPDGSYSYKLDVTNPKVSSLDASRTLSEVFVYTITDADGDTSTATLTITIHGTTPPIQARQGDEIWPIGYDHTQRDIRQAWEPGLFVLPDGVEFSQKLLEDIEAQRRVGDNDFARDHSPLWDDFSPFAPAKLAEKHADDKHHQHHEKDHAKHAAHTAPHASHEPPQVPVAIHVPPPASTPGGAPSLSARIAAMAKAKAPEIAAVPTTQPRH